MKDEGKPHSKTAKINPASAGKLLLLLEDLSLLYADLIVSLSEEQHLLILADVEKLVENTRLKEKLLYRIRQLDRQRQTTATDVARELGLSLEDGRLLELAKHTMPDLAAQLRRVHESLSQQIHRVIDMNDENERFAQSALRTLNGAMDEIKQTVTVKPTYGRMGRMAGSHETNSGNFVRREV